MILSGYPHIMVSSILGLHHATLPLMLASLTFGRSFNQSLEGLPVGLESLTLGREFISFKQLALPSGLRNLTLGSFNGSLEQLNLPSLRSLRSLVLGNAFNENLGKHALPPNLESLTFGYQFNQSLKQVSLPTTLKSLTFGRNFNQPLQAGSGFILVREVNRLT